MTIAQQVEFLSASAVECAAAHPDMLNLLIDAIKHVNSQEIDHYAMIGLLLDAAAGVLQTSIPKQRQSEIGAAMLDILAQQIELRLSAPGSPWSADWEPV